MKRFTFTSDDYWAVDNQNCFEDQSEDYCGPAIDRLAAYEDTGLLPQEVSAKVMWADTAAKALSNIFGDVGVFDLSKLNDINKSAEQSWIPVTERLPELIPCNAGTAYSEAVIVWTDGRKAMIAVWDGIDFLCAASYWEAEGESITHWMPLPEVPKDEQ